MGNVTTLKVLLRSAIYYCKCAWLTESYQSYISLQHTDFEITYGRRPFSIRIIRTADHITTCAVAVADRRILSPSIASS